MAEGKKDYFMIIAIVAIVAIVAIIIMVSGAGKTTRNISLGGGAEVNTDVSGKALASNPPKVTCTDSDFGLDFNVKGNTYGYKSNGVPVSHTDYCASSMNLKEGACFGSYADIVEHICPKGCLDGRCDILCQDQLVLDGSFNTFSGTGIYVVGDLVYLADAAEGVYVFKRDHKTGTLTLDGSYDTGYAEDIYVVGDLVYVALYYNGIKVLKRNPTTGTLTLDGSYDTDIAETVFVVGDLIYVADRYEGVKVLKRNPTTGTLTLDGSFTAVEEANSVYAVNNLVYVANAEDGILVLKRDPTTGVMTLDKSFDTSYAADIYVVGSLIYVADWDGGVKVLKRDTKTGTLTLDGSFSTNSAWRIRASGDFVYVADSTGGVKVLKRDYATGALTLDASYNVEKTSDVFGVDNLVYTAVDGGVRVLKLECKVPSCIDSDGGRDYFVKGSVSVNGVLKGTDTCASTQEVIETYCLNGQYATETMHCYDAGGEQGRCSQGACY